MPSYRVLINGKNFLVSIDGDNAKRGFYTNRYVIADDVADAELQAVQALRDDQRLREMVGNLADDRPMMYVEEIVEVDSFEPGTVEGLAWYQMDGENDPKAPNTTTLAFCQQLWKKVTQNWMRGR